MFELIDEISALGGRHGAAIGRQQRRAAHARTAIHFVFMQKTPL